MCQGNLEANSGEISGQPSILMNLLRFDKERHDLDCYLNSDDWHSLDGWLTDNVIQFACEVIEKNCLLEASRGDIHMLHPTACLLARTNPKDVLEHFNFDKKSWIFCPVNNASQSGTGGDHWSLLIISNETNISYYLDSMLGSNYNIEHPTVSLRIAKEMNDSICDFLHIKRELHIIPCAQQTNFSDCGVYVVLYILWVCTFILNNDASWIEKGVKDKKFLQMASIFRSTLKKEIELYFKER